MAEHQPILERMSLKGKAAIVTGAGRGIARAFAEAGADRTPLRTSPARYFRSTVAGWVRRGDRPTCARAAGT